MQLTFLGATGCVTGSKYLLEVDNKRILIDCGLFQGQKELRLRNWDPLPIDPHTIDVVILTHAHIDHTGYLPLLVRSGFSGPIYATPATKDLCTILLPDSAHLQEEEAFYANKLGYSKHHPALPLYTQTDAWHALNLFKTIEYSTWLPLSDNISFSFLYAGHILGAAFILFKYHGTTVLFTGDMGRPNDPVMRDPTYIEAVDYLVLESTYGDRLHHTNNPEQQLADIINQTIKRGGSIIIPAFAVGRTQNILYYLLQLKRKKQIPNIPVFLDSPMAENATEVFLKYAGEHRLSKHETIETCKVAHYINSIDESKHIDELNMPVIIISASGMATGGRVLHHLKIYAPNPLNTILFTGYQAEGTRGDRLLQGDHEIKIHGQMIPVRAQIKMITNASAHADYKEILNWLDHFQKAPKNVFIVHGESNAAISLKAKIEQQYGWQCNIPTYMQTEILK